jgi:dipeptidyl aminopeptidase/acylaminoacyl peptidase
VIQNGPFYNASPNSKANVCSRFRIIHGVQDEVVPFDWSLKLMQLIVSEDIDVIFRKSGQHRLSEPADLKAIAQTLDQLIETLRPSPVS